MSIKPAKVQFQPKTPVDTDWQVEGLRVHDRLGHPLEIRVALHTRDRTAEPSQFLGQSASVVIERGELHQELGGIVHSVQEGDDDGHELHVTLTLVPALMALAQRRNSRIFQNQTIPEILKQVLSEGLGPYERVVDTEGLVAAHPPQEYTVQYRETDLDFVHRLMEEYGISYRFVTEGGIETLVLSDGETVFGELRSAGNTGGALPVKPATGDPGLREDAQQFSRVSALRPTVARTAVFDWHVPQPLQDGEDANALSLASPDGASLGPEREDYDHLEPSTLFGHRSSPLEFSAVERQLQLRRALHQRDAVRCTGTSTATQMTPGLRFELLDHGQDELCGEYVLVGVEHLFGVLAGGEAGSAYRNTFECLPAAVPWRPDRVHARPRIAGMQTATVVGPAGEEIHTDAHGRIQVQFHWDRAGQFGADASCFVRVVQPWAGDGWGSMFLPRVGMEVAVTFVDGDPDRPVVTGCLYNGTHAPPYALPGERTRSAIKTSSTPGGGGSNELRFDDAAGAEEIYVHAQKDMNEEVGNDHGVTVSNNQTTHVQVDQTLTVGGNQTQTVDGNKAVTVKANQDVTVQGSHTKKVTGAVDETLMGGVVRNITAGVSEQVTGGVTSTVNGGVTNTVNGALTTTVNGGTTLAHHGSVNDTIDGSYGLTAVGGVKISAPAGMTIAAPGGMNVVDPATTTEVHGIFESTKGYSGSATGFKFSVTGGQLAVLGIGISLSGVKIDATGMSVSAIGVKMANTPLTVEQAALKLKFGAIGCMMYGLTMFM